MGSNLFFPANRQRYDRVQGLSNNIDGVKGQSAQIYDQLKTEADHLDTLCKDLMTKHGAKTLKEYAEAIANTLPTAERDRVLHLLKTFEDADVFLTNASSVITAVLAGAGGTRLISGSAKMLVEILSEGVFRAEFARGFRLFVSGSLKEGTRVMRGVSKWARNHYEFLGELAPGARAARAVRILRVFNTVLEFIAKWAFVLDLVVLFLQYQMEEQQRTELRKGIHDFFCQRFSVQMQFDQFKVTQALYTQLRGFVQTRTILEANPNPTTPTVIESLGDAFMNTHEGDMQKITDDSVWAECVIYDANAWKDEDPDKAEVLRWMEEQRKKDPDDIKDQDKQ